jgi:acyl homoserine lactone synthase
MALQITIAPRREFKSKDLWEMHRLRAQVFSGRLGWEVPVLSGMEIDGYDALDPYYMMIREPGGALRGCSRLLPTEGPYMLKDSFPQLLHGKDAPQLPGVWELSRLAIETGSSSSFGFSDITLQASVAMALFGKENGIERFVTVTTPGIERMLRRAGAAISRLGEPLQMGVAAAVALYMETEQTYQGMLDHRMVS